MLIYLSVALLESSDNVCALRVCDIRLETCGHCYSSTRCRARWLEWFGTTEEAAEQGAHECKSYGNIILNVLCFLKQQTTAYKAGRAFPICPNAHLSPYPSLFSEQPCIVDTLPREYNGSHCLAHCYYWASCVLASWMVPYRMCRPFRYMCWSWIVSHIAIAGLRASDHGVTC